VNHWLGALAYIYLLITGLAFWSPYLYWLAAVVGGGPTARFWHPWLGLIFAVSLFWTFKEWRRDMQIDERSRVGKAIPDYIQNEDDKPASRGALQLRTEALLLGNLLQRNPLAALWGRLWYTEALPWSLRLCATRPS
jgi:formate dehydrogenase subunit gamma